MEIQRPIQVTEDLSSFWRETYPQIKPALAGRYPSVLTGLRGRGLMLGLECVVPAGEMVARLREAGLLTVGAAENVVRIVPPLIIDETHVDEALAILEQVCEGWAEAA